MLAAAALILGSCLGTGAKKLGTGTGSGNTPSNIADALAVTFAFRDLSTDATTPSRIVILQGQLTNTAGKFERVCGTDGSGCTCEFYNAAKAGMVGTSGSLSYSAQNNTLSCTIDDVAANAPNYRFVRLRNLGGDAATGFLNIPLTSPSLSDVLQGLDSTKVRKIKRYECVRTFLEGESVTPPSSVTCAPSGHHLGWLYARYYYYLFSANGGLDSNETTKAGQEFYPSGAGSLICGLTIPSYDCTASTPALLFGLYKEPAGPFVASITLAPGPNASAPNGPPLIMGYAALPDNGGNCPVGLSRARRYTAVPPSILVGSALNGIPAVQPYATTFINAGGSLNSVVYDVSAPTANFTIDRQPHATGCSVVSGGNFNCATPPNGGLQPGAISTPFTPELPVICVLPASAISSLP